MVHTLGHEHLVSFIVVDATDDATSRCGQAAACWFPCGVHHAARRAAWEHDRVLTRLVLLGGHGPTAVHFIDLADTGQRARVPTSASKGANAGTRARPIIG